MVDTTKILKEYRITEKSSVLNEQLLKYTFEVAKEANKAQIAEAIEQVFEVKVARVNVINKKAKFKANRMRAGRPGEKPAIKKAIVTLKEGDKIELF